MALRASNESLPLADLIQSTANARRTARIVAESPEGDGQIYLIKGQVVHAVYGDLIGSEAVYAMVAAPELEYQVEPGVTTPTRTVDAPWQELLLDAARREDEGSLPRPSAGPARLDILDVSPGASGSLASASMIASSPEPRPTRGSPRWRIPALLGGLAIVTAAIGGYAMTLDREDADAPAASPVASAGASDLAAPIDEHVYEASELQGSDDRPPRLIHGSSAIAPRKTSLAPNVVVRVQIGRAGEVVERTILRPRPELADFEAAALAAIQHYEFAAAERRGQSVAAWLTVPVSFDQPSALGLRAVRIKGSDTIGGELGPALAAGYADDDPHVLVSVEAQGSSSGFVGLFDASAEIGASSRPLDAKELAEAERLDVGLRELVIGYDGIAVIVHPDNPIRALDMVQLADLFRGETTNWQQLGGEDRSVALLSRPDASGTHGLFLTKVLQAETNAEFASHTRYVETSQELVAAVAEDPGAIGYVGVAWATSNVEVLAIAPAPGQPALEPSAATIGAGSYPIYRPLIFYTRQQLDRDALGFLRFVLGERGQRIVAEHGFVPVGAQAEEALPRLEDAVDLPDVHVTRLRFDSAVTELSEDQRATLADLAALLNESAARVVIVGNSESEGLVEGNERLAMQRARSVREHMLGEGVAAARIELRSAATQSVSEDPERRAERRRVDVYVLE
ncbi:TonB family protein [Nannocystaceae bacterium ST9]